MGKCGPVLVAGASPGNLSETQILMAWRVWPSNACLNKSPGDFEKLWSLRTTGWLEDSEMLPHPRPHRAWGSEPSDGGWVHCSCSHHTLKGSFLSVSLRREHSFPGISSEWLDPQAFTRLILQRKSFRGWGFPHTEARGCQGPSWCREHWVWIYTSVWYIEDWGTLPFLSPQ